MSGPENDQLAVTILMGFFVARAFFALMLGLGIDESYTVAISRGLALSYFDHPSVASVDHAFRRPRSRRERGRSRALCRPLRGDGLDRLSIREPSVRRSGGSDRAFRPERYALLLRLRRKLDCSGWPAALRASYSGVGGEPSVLSGTARRRGLGLAILAACRRRPGSGWTVEIQRRADRRRVGGVRPAFAQAAALAQTSRAIRLRNRRIRDDRSGHLVECAARLGVV